MLISVRRGKWGKFGGSSLLYKHIVDNFLSPPWFRRIRFDSFFKLQEHVWISQKVESDTRLLDGCIPSQARWCEISRRIKLVFVHSNLSEVLKNNGRIRTCLEVKIVIICHYFVPKRLPKSERVHIQHLWCVNYKALKIILPLVATLSFIFSIESKQSYGKTPFVIISV